jgi:hypothetical protein
MNTKTITSNYAILLALGVSLLHFNSKAQTYGSITPYTTDASTVLLDHFNGSTAASILAFTNNGAPCGSPRPPIAPNYSWVSGPAGLNQGLSLLLPLSDPTGRSYLNYLGGELLSQPNGTLECWIYLTSYDFNIHQLEYVGECVGDVGGISVTPTGKLQADIWYTAFNTFSFDSGTSTVPLNAWTHVALCWGSQGAKLYINGVLVGSNPNTGSFAHWGGDSVFVFGNGASFDELRISSVQRTNFNLSCTTCPPAVNLKLFAGLIINGAIGSNYNIQATSVLGATNWVTLTNVTLQTDPYIYVDYRSWTNTQQFYRIVP